jgi:hypothetical protein
MMSLSPGTGASSGSRANKLLEGSSTDGQDYAEPLAVARTTAPPLVTATANRTGGRLRSDLGMSKKGPRLQAEETQKEKARQAILTVAAALAFTVSLSSMGVAAPPKFPVNWLGEWCGDYGPGVKSDGWVKRGECDETERHTLQQGRYRNYYAACIETKHEVVKQGVHRVRYRCHQTKEAAAMPQGDGGSPKSWPIRCWFNLDMGDNGKTGWMDCETALPFRSEEGRAK